MAETVDIAADRLHAELVAALTAAGSFGESDRALAAQWIAQAEALGLPEFGIDMLLRELSRVAALPAAPSACADAAPTPVASIDAAGVPGPVALAAAVRLAAAGAQAFGVGAVGIRNVGALGVLGLPARELAGLGLVGLVSAHAPAFVAPYGGTQPAIGTNPLAIAAPREQESPFVADFATAPLTLAALRTARESGTELPEGAVVDVAGEPTRDPARAAAILPDSLVGSLGGLLVELLAGVAVGGRVPAGAPVAGRGAFVLALDPASLGGARAPLDTAQLVADWRDAGGHVPRRFDRLPPVGSQPGETGTVQVPAAAHAALRAAASETFPGGAA